MIELEGRVNLTFNHNMTPRRPSILSYRNVLYLGLMLTAGGILASDRKAKADVPEFDTNSPTAMTHLDIAGEHQFRRRYVAAEDAEYFLSYTGSYYALMKSVSGGTPAEVAEFSGDDIRDFDIDDAGLEMTIYIHPSGVYTYTRANVGSPFTNAGFAPVTGTFSYNETDAS